MGINFDITDDTIETKLLNWYSHLNVNMLHHKGKKDKNKNVSWNMNGEDAITT